MEDLSDFERRQIVGARLAGASVTNTATLLGVSTVTVSKVMSAYTNRGKTTSAKRNEQQAKINTDRKRSLYTEKDCLISHNYCSPGDSRTKYSSDDSVSTKYT
jgi:IS30 family transposase